MVCFFKSNCFNSNGRIKNNESVASKESHEVDSLDRLRGGGGLGYASLIF